MTDINEEEDAPIGTIVTFRGISVGNLRRALAELLDDDMLIQKDEPDERHKDFTVFRDGERYAFLDLVRMEVKRIS